MAASDREQAACDASRHKIKEFLRTRFKLAEHCIPFCRIYLEQRRTATPPHYQQGFSHKARRERPSKRE